VGTAYAGNLWALKVQADAVVLRALRDSSRTPGTNAFQFSATAPPGLYATEYSSDFLSWTPLQTDSMTTGPLILSASVATNGTPRFYRLRGL
jgi:hypothetical protein